MRDLLAALVLVGALAMPSAALVSAPIAHANAVDAPAPDMPDAPEADVCGPTSVAAEC